MKDLAKRRREVSFPDWKVALENDPLPEAQREEYRHAIFAFLPVCKQRRAAAAPADAGFQLGVKPAAERIWIRVVFWGQILL